MEWLVERLKVDPASAIPPFDQVRRAIVDAVHDGRLSAGSRLTTVRELAGGLGIAANTVARAYRELEIAGVVETRGRRGTFVACSDPTDVRMTAAAQVFAQTARTLGLDRNRAVRYLDTAFGEPD